MKIRGSVPYYTKIRLRTHKNISSSFIWLPEEELNTLLGIAELEGGAR